MGTAMNFQSGGALRSASLYVERAADKDLYEALRKGEFCFVLAPRQIGKSSLCNRVRKRLQAGDSNTRCANIDLQRIGAKNLSLEQWYLGLMEELRAELELEDDPTAFWDAHEKLSAVQRWSLFLREIVLKRLSGPVIVFIDEIDQVLSLDASISRDDFFGSIRAIYNARPELEAFHRLTFCLIGVAQPSELTADPVRTPFNIGHEIQLKDFSREEANGFLEGLKAAGGNADALLSEVYAWTSGHPYMMQKICNALLKQEESEPGGEAQKRVFQAVHEGFLREGAQSDQNLAFAEKHFVLPTMHPLASQMLAMYKTLLKGEAVKSKRDHTVQARLKLTGMVAEHGSLLQVRNRIFAEVFDIDWVRDKESDRVMQESCSRWLENGRKPEYALRGEALENAKAWAKGRDDLSPDEQAYLLASAELAQEEAMLKERTGRLEAERRFFWGVSIILVLGGLIATRFQMRFAAEQERRSMAEGMTTLTVWTNQLEGYLRRAHEEVASKAYDEAERRAKEEAAKAEELNRQLEQRPSDEDLKKLRDEAEKKKAEADAAKTKAAAGLNVMDTALKTCTDGKLGLEKKLNSCTIDLNTCKNLKLGL